MRNFEHFLFYSNQISRNSVILDPAETTHAVKVLRLREGDCFNVTDGQGTIHTCTLEMISGHSAKAAINCSQSHKRHDTHIHLYIGLPDRDSLETALVNCTALGVEHITPVICDFCQDQWWKRSWLRDSERLRNKMISAMKQSLYPFLPEFDNPVRMEDALTTTPGLKIVADAKGKPLRLFSDLTEAALISCFVGPPGGYSQAELSLLIEQGFFSACISPTRLRTELASEVICAQIMCLQ